MGAAGQLHVLEAYRPAQGGTVWRVQLPLSSTALGTRGGVAVAVVDQIRGQVAFWRAAVLQDAQAAKAAQVAVGSEQAAMPMANAATMPVAQQVLDQARAVLSAAATKLSADRRNLAAAQGNVADIEKITNHLHGLTALGTYDVWLKAASVVAWGPPGYQAAGRIRP